MPFTSKQKQFFSIAAAGKSNKKDGPSPEEAKKMLKESKDMPTKPPVKDTSNDHDEDDSGMNSKSSGEKCPECGMAMVDGKCPECSKSKGTKAVDKYSKTMKKGKKWGEESKKKTAGFLDSK